MRDVPTAIASDPKTRSVAIRKYRTGRSKGILRDVCVKAKTLRRRMMGRGKLEEDACVRIGLWQDGPEQLRTCHHELTIDFHLPLIFTFLRHLAVILVLNLASLY